jgi:hypothetical protein
MPLQATSGAASYDAFGGGVPVVPNYIEEVFSTYLYTGNGSTQTITNGIDLSTEGGLVWIKSRNLAEIHQLFDTERGIYNRIYSNLTNAQNTGTNSLTAFNSNGFSIGDNNISNTNNDPLVSWTFRKQPKFFDVLTYTGNGTNRTIAHNLGSVPGCIIIKDASAVSNWYVYHRSLATNQALKLNSTAAIETSTTFWNNTAATSSVFSLGTAGDVNGNGDSFVAYVFAHDAGGFGLTGTDNVISCGSYTGNSSSFTPITLGYETQWLMIKRTDGVGNWVIFDTTRGMPTFDSTGAAYAQILRPNLALQETTGNATPYPVSTGFGQHFADGDFTTGNFIYIAIRRGPMKVPTVGTSVFDAGTRAGSASDAKTNSDILTDLSIIKRYTSASEYWAWANRLVGNLTLKSNSTAAENSGAMATNAWDTMTGAFAAASNGATNTSTLIDYSFQRAPSFMDVVCYTGTGVNGRSVSHNLAVAPELIIAKRRTVTASWLVYHNSIGTGQYLILNSIGGPATDANMWGNTTPTSSNFYVGSSTNFSGFDYVSYLFSTCVGVSKVGSYTGTGSTLQINCGFTSGARFVLIKRGDGSGDWYVWDSARGIVSGNDPYLLLNDTAAEDTSTDYIDTYSAGFEVTTGAAVNSVGDSFIFLAIA